MASSEIDRLLKPAGSRRLKPAAKRDPIPKSESVVTPQDTSERGTNIASPLTEIEWATPEYWNVTSADGLFSMRIPKESHFTDDAGQEVVIKWRDPNL